MLLVPIHFICFSPPFTNIRKLVPADDIDDRLKIKDQDILHSYEYSCYSSLYALDMIARVLPLDTCHDYAGIAN